MLVHGARRIEPCYTVSMTTEAPFAPPEAPPEEAPAAQPAPPTHPVIAEARAAFEAGDHRRARALLEQVPSEAALGEADRAALAYLRRALSLDPMIAIVGIALAGLWLFLFVRVAFT